MFTIYQVYILSYQTNCLELNVVNWQATFVDNRCGLQKLQSKICYIEVSLFLPLCHFVLILRFCYLLLIFLFSLLPLGIFSYFDNLHILTVFNLCLCSLNCIWKTIAVFNFCSNKYLYMYTYFWGKKFHKTRCTPTEQYPLFYQYLLLKISKITKKSAHYLLVVTEDTNTCLYSKPHAKKP